MGFRGAASVYSDALGKRFDDLENDNRDWSLGSVAVNSFSSLTNCRYRVNFKMIFVNRKFINCVVTAGEKVRKFLIFRDHACLFEFHAFESRSLSRILFSLISLLFVFISIKTHIFSYIFFSFWYLHSFLLLLYLSRGIAIFDSTSRIFVSNLWIMNLLSLMYVQIFIFRIFCSSLCWFIIYNHRQCSITTQDKSC